MIRNETRLMESAIALAEELHYQRAARKVGISQPMLTKNIQDLESLLGGPLFLRDRRTVALSDAGRAYIQHARFSLLYGERAFNDARAVLQGIDMPVHIGRSPHVDPYFVTVLLSLHLPLYPKLRIELASQYSVDLVHDLLDGVLDLAIANEPPESTLLTKIQIADSPFYIAVAHRDALAAKPAINFTDINGRRWIMFERRFHPPLYDLILEMAERSDVRPGRLQHIRGPEEAFPFVADSSAVAFIPKAGALLLARDGITVRPLAEPRVRLRTFLVSRADNDSKIASEIVRTFVRKIEAVGTYKQLPLPMTA